MEFKNICLINLITIDFSIKHNLSSTFVYQCKFSVAHVRFNFFVLLVDK